MKENKEIKNEEKCYKLYKHINKVNGHFYIGITSLEPNQRFGKNGGNYKKCTYFWNAIQKYGWDNFEHIIIVDNLTKEEACKYEIDLIERAKREEPNCCYNILSGGDLGRKDVIITEEYRDKFRGSKNPVAKSVICIETNKIFDTITDASKFYNIDRKNIIRACQTGIACGRLDNKKLHWAYFDKENNTFNLVEHNRHERRVYCETTELWFNSIKEASEYYGVSRDSIWWSCKHNSTTRYGYRWRYADDKNNEYRETI